MLDNLVYVFLENTFTLKEYNKYPYTYNELPPYYLDTINFNKSKFGKTFLLISEKQRQLLDRKTPADINLITIESLHESKLYKDFITLFEEKWTHYKKDVFLYHAFLRVIYYCIFVDSYSLQNCIHAEADNLIFSSNKDLFLNVFKSGEFGFSNEKVTNSAPAIIFLRDKSSAENLLNLHLKLLKKGETNIIQTIGIPFSYITDMNFLYLISLYGVNYQMLPCLPFGEQSKNFDKFNMLFDPTSYGQYLGGTNNGHNIGYFSIEHYVGREISNKNIEVVLRDKRPYVKYSNIEIPLFNLHIQNKKSIKKFIY